MVRNTARFFKVAPANRQAPAAGERPRTRRMGQQGETGSVLLLALIYIVSISLVVGALVSWAMNDLNNTSRFQSARSVDYAASSATEVAIQSIRYKPLIGATLNASPPVNCWTPLSGTTSQLPIDGVTMGVWCSTAENLASADTRVVTIVTCLVSVAPTGALCQAKPLLSATVTFNDYPPGGSAPLTVQCSTWCGQGSKIDSWTWT